MVAPTKPLAFSIRAVLGHSTEVLRRNIVGFGVLTIVVQGAAFLIRRSIGADPMPEVFY
jgi:hypothetical protein